MQLIVTALLVLAAGLVGCRGPAAARYSLPKGEPVEHVYVIRHGWHTRIAVRQADVDLAVWPESRDLEDIAWLEVGWGDRDYYPEPDPSIWDALNTVIRPTPAALHVGGFDRPPSEFLPHAPMVRIPVSGRGLDRLARFIHEHYELRRGERVRIRPGNYERSWFYLATGRYHALFIQQQQHLGGQGARGRRGADDAIARRHGKQPDVAGGAIRDSGRSPFARRSSSPAEPGVSWDAGR